jgi:hypothetical protein
MTSKKTLEFLVEASLALGGCNVAAYAQDRRHDDDAPLFLPDVSPPPFNPQARNTRNTTTRSAQLLCFSYATKALENYSGSDAARGYAAGAFFMSCVVKLMPPGWSDSGTIASHGGELAARARQADPSIDPCLLSACMVDRRTP